jgi:TDG/mug DNA glycosylase family protein
MWQPVWEVLPRTGLTPSKLDPHEFRTLLRYGIGLTYLAKICSGPDNAISSSDFDIPGFCSKIKRFSPKVVAFNSKTAARAFFGCSVGYGGPRLDERAGETVISVLPSTPAAACRYWEESYWSELTRFIHK